MELQALIDGLKAHKYGAASYESVDEAIRAFEAMRDVDAEKVRKGYECCYMDKSPKHCEGCPYNMNNEGCGHDTFALERDALSLIRQQQERIAELEAAQTARVMTLDELKEGDIVYIEGLSYISIAEIKRSYSSEIVFYGCGNEIHMPRHRYGEIYRCWTQRPTDEQRKAVPWE